MSKLPARKTRIHILALLLAASCSATVSGGPPIPNDDTYTAAVRLMRAFYPQLTGKGVVMDVEARYPLDADGPLLAFYLRVSESDQTEHIVASPYPNPSSAERVGQLAAHFQFDGRDHGIFSMFARGSFLNGEKQQALAKLVDEHPDWSEARMTEALLAAGAKFGPKQKEALLARFPLKELESILGKIEMGPAQFTFRGNTEPPFYAVMDCSIRFLTAKDGKRDEYTVSLEPFEGKVVTLGRRALN